MAKRKFLKQLKEHCNDMKHHNPSTVMSIFYLNNYNCLINFENARVILISNTSPNILIRESIEMVIRNDEVCNDNVLYSIPKKKLNILRNI